MIDHTSPDWQMLGYCAFMGVISAALFMAVLIFILKMLTTSPKQKFGTQEKENGNE